MGNGQRKKILFVITKSVWGGAQRYVFDLAANLPRESFDTAVATGGNGHLMKRLQEKHIPVCNIASFQKTIDPFKDIAAFFELLSVYKRFKPDVIHTNSSKAGGIASLAALVYRILSRTHVLCVFTVHGWAFLELWRPRWQQLLIRFFSNITALLHDAVIVISEHDYAAASTYNVVPISKVTLIHNGIGAIDFLTRKEAQRELFGKELNLVIGTIAEWTKNKGLEYLLDAMSAILTICPETAVCLIGWGEDSEKLKVKSEKLGLGNYIYFLSRPSAAAYLKAFDIYVLPSLKEGLPYTLLEAGLAELPVVATRVGGIPDIIEDRKNGILIDPASPSQLADTITNLLQNQTLREHMGQELRRRVEQNFSLSRMIQKTIEVYRS